MEPILQNPLFPQILRVWKFFTHYHDYLQLPDQFSQVSLYEFQQHIAHKSFTTTFIAQLIQALLHKTQIPEKYKKLTTTAFALAKQNKFHFFNEIAILSAYELGLSEVSLSMKLKNQEPITQKSFEELKENQKLMYLSNLIDLVVWSDSFKKTYFDTLKAEYTSALEANKKNALEIEKKFFPKLFYKLSIGKDSKGNAYFYVPKIGDSILRINERSRKWTKIQGHANIKKEIFQKILQNPESIRNEDIDLIQQIHILWKNIGWNIECTAFDRRTNFFKINDGEQKIDKTKIIREKMHLLDQEYTKFISDCFNSRWATKTRRIEYHKEIDEAENMQDILACFSGFFNEVKNTTHRKVDTLDFYDTRLDTADQKPDQFKTIYLSFNYLFSKPVVFSCQKNDPKSCLLHYIKDFLENSIKYNQFLFEFLYIFVQTILKTIEELYPKMYQKRIKQIQRLEENKRKREQNQEERIKNKLKLKKHNKRVSNGSQESSQEDQSQTQEQHIRGQKMRKMQQGRRLRQKARVNYSTTTSNSLSRPMIMKTNRYIKKVQPNNKRYPLRVMKKGISKNKRMVLDSDSQQQEWQQQQSVSLSLSDDKQNQKSKRQQRGINLDKFKYEQTSPKVSLRRLKSSKIRE